MGRGTVDVGLMESKKLGPVMEGILKGGKDAVVARENGISSSTVATLRRKYLPTYLYEKRLEADDGARWAITKAMDSMRKMVEAMTEWMTDPDDPSKFSVSPRADELTVVYEAMGDDGKLRRRKATLQSLLDTALGNHKEAINVKFTGTDSRLVFLKSMDTYKGMIDTMAKMTGEMHDDVGAGVTVNIATQQNAAIQIEMVRRKYAEELKKAVSNG